MSDIQIVAEIGCNHNGSVELAKKMMKKAKEAGADAVKFQSFVPENLVSRYAPKAEYQKKNDGNGSQLDMLKKLALTETEYLELVQYASTLIWFVFAKSTELFILLAASLYFPSKDRISPSSNSIL